MDIYFAFLKAVKLAFEVYELLIFIRIIMSWININPYSSFARFVSNLTDPFLGFIERYMPEPLLSPLNFSPIIAILLLNVIQSILFRILYLLV